jgi:type I restriction enzyme S subunit
MSKQAKKALVPKLRFPEFRDAGEWELKELGDLVDIKSGISPSRYDLTDRGKYAFLKVEDLNNCEKYQKKSREYTNGSENLIPSRSIIFPKRGAAILRACHQLSHITLAVR